MGNFLSVSESYVDVWKFDSDSQIDFEFDQLRTWETVKAAGQQQALAQVANVGGLGGGAGGFSALTPWGQSPSIWLSLSNFFVVAAAIVVPAATVIAVLAFTLHFGGAAAALSVFFAVLFGSIWLMYHTTRGLRLATFPTLTLYGLMAAGIAATVAALGYRDPPSQQQDANAGGVAAGGGSQTRALKPLLPAQPVRF